MLCVQPDDAEEPCPLRGSVLLLLQGLLQEEHPEAGEDGLQGGWAVHSHAQG